MMVSDSPSRLCSSVPSDDDIVRMIREEEAMLEESNRKLMEVIRQQEEVFAILGQCRRAQTGVEEEKQGNEDEADENDTSKEKGKKRDGNDEVVVNDMGTDGNNNFLYFLYCPYIQNSRYFYKNSTEFYIILQNSVEFYRIL